MIRWKESVFNRRLALKLFPIFKIVFKSTLAYKGSGPAGSVSTMTGPISGATSAGANAGSSAGSSTGSSAGSSSGASAGATAGAVAGKAAALAANAASRSQMQTAVDAAFTGLLGNGGLGSAFSVLGGGIKRGMGFGRKRSFHKHPGSRKKNVVEKHKKRKKRNFKKHDVCE